MGTMSCPPGLDCNQHLARKEREATEVRSRHASLHSRQMPTAMDQRDTRAISFHRELNVHGLAGIAMSPGVPTKLHPTGRFPGQHGSPLVFFAGPSALEHS